MMSISLSSARRIAAGAVGASAVAGAMLFGATAEANAAPPPAPQMLGLAHVAHAPAALQTQPAFFNPVPDRGGFGHGGRGFGRGGFGRGYGHGGWGRGGWGRGGWDRGGWGWGHRGWW